MGISMTLLEADDFHILCLRNTGGWGDCSRRMFSRAVKITKSYRCPSPAPMGLSWVKSFCDGMSCHTAIKHDVAKQGFNDMEKIMGNC